MKNAALALLLLATPAVAQQPQYAPPGSSPPQYGQQQPNYGQPNGAPPQMPPSTGYRLSMQPIETCHRAMMSLLARAKTDPSIRAEQERTAQPDGDTPEQVVAFMRSQAPASTAFMSSNGCSPDEYVKIGLASMEGAMALDMIEHKGPVNTLSPSARANADFIRANATRLQQIDEEADRAEEAAGLQPQQPPQPPQAAQPPQAPLPWQQQQAPQRR